MNLRFSRVSKMDGAEVILRVHHRLATECFYLQVGDGGTLRDFSLTWLVFREGEPPVLSLKMFDDAFGAFSEVPELFAGLAKLGEGASPSAVRDFLLSIGAEENLYGYKGGDA